MADTTVDIARQIEDERRQLECNVSELTARAAATVDWREHVRQRPVLMVAAALGGGVVLAQLGGRGRRGAVPPGSQQIAALGGPFESFVGALVATALGAIVTSFSEAAPGFLDEFRKRRATTSPDLVTLAVNQGKPTPAAGG